MITRRYEPTMHGHSMRKIDVDKIRSLHAMGISLADIARRFGVSGPYISKIVGRTPSPAGAHGKAESKV